MFFLFNISTINYYAQGTSQFYRPMIFVTKLMCHWEYLAHFLIIALILRTIIHTLLTFGF